MTHTPEKIEGMAHVPGYGYIPQPDLRVEQLETAVLELSVTLRAVVSELREIKQKILLA